LKSEHACHSAGCAYYVTLNMVKRAHSEEQPYKICFSPKNTLFLIVKLNNVPTNVYSCLSLS